MNVIRYAHIDANNVLLGTLQDLATSAGSPVAFKMGPDGFLYYAAYFTGRIYRINPPPPSSFHTLTPCRVVDTRNAAGPYGGPVFAANSTRTFTMTGQCGIPSSARAVSLNVTVTLPTALGDLRLFPGGAQLPELQHDQFQPGTDPRQQRPSAAQHERRPVRPVRHAFGKRARDPGRQRIHGVARAKEAA